MKKIPKLFKKHQKVIWIYQQNRDKNVYDIQLNTDVLSYGLMMLNMLHVNNEKILYENYAYHFIGFFNDTLKSDKFTPSEKDNLIKWLDIITYRLFLYYDNPIFREIEKCVMEYNDKDDLPF